MDRQFPRLVIRRDKLRNNFTQIVSRCRACGINVAGVIKGVGGLPEIARLYKECGAAQLATSRLEQIELWRREGVDGPFLLLRVPGIGPVSARRIVSARRCGTLRFEDLQRLGVVLKRAQYFLTCGGKLREGLRFSPATLPMQLERMERGLLPEHDAAQLSLFDRMG